jgi:hypothetical protein
MQTYAKHECLSGCAERNSLLGLLIARTATVYYREPEASETLKSRQFFILVSTKITLTK